MTTLESKTMAQEGQEARPVTILERPLDGKADVYIVPPDPGRESTKMEVLVKPATKEQVTGSIRETQDQVVLNRWEWEEGGPPPSGGSGGGDGGGEGGEGNPEIPRGQKPEDIARKLQLMHREVERMADMPDSVREHFIKKYNEYSQIFNRYYNDHKIFDIDAQVSNIRKGLENFDDEHIKQMELSAEDESTLRDLLKDLDAATERHKEYTQTIIDLKEGKVGDDGVAIRPQASGLFDRKGWKEQEKRRDNKAHEADSIRTKLKESDMYRRFLEARDIKKVEIKKQAEKWKEEKNKQNAEDLRQTIGEPDKEFEAKLVEEDKEIEFTQEQIDALPNFADASTGLNQQEDLWKIGSKVFSLEDYNKFKEIVSWYFQEAERRGIVYDLKKDLNQRFEGYMQSLGFRPESRVQPLSFSEVVRTLRAGATNEEFLQQFEGETWDEVRETARLNVGDERFQGIRAEYMRRAYEQMRVAFTNLEHLQDRLNSQTGLVKGEITKEQYQKEVVKLPRDIARDNLYGEWNFGMEARERRNLEEIARREQNKPLFIRNPYGMIELLGRNSQEIQKGAEQAAEFIINSAATYSLESVQQNRDLLIRAIEDQRTLLETEAGTKEKGDDLIKRIKRIALNKLDFYILHWLAQNLRMDEYAGYWEQTVQVDGVDRLKEIPGMSSGLVGLGIHFLYQPEYELFFRPAGFRNQLNESGSQGYLRDMLKKQLVEKMLGFELADKKDDVSKTKSTEEFLRKFKQYSEKDPNHPKQRLEKAREIYKTALAKAKTLSTDSKALLELREARELLAFEQHKYQTAKETVSNALEEAIRVMDITGESARIGRASIVMNNGDRISIDEAKLFYKFAILQAAKAYGDTHQIKVEEDGKEVTYRVEDNVSNIRKRSMEWITRWKKNRHFMKVRDEHMTDEEKQQFRDFQATLKNGEHMKFSLANGFEKTGFTVEEWQAFKDADKQLREKGYQSQWNGMKFADIVKMDEIQPVLSNFVADYKSSGDQFEDDYLRSQAVGRIEGMQSILRRFEYQTGFKGKVGGDVYQDRLNKYTSLVTDSTRFDQKVENLVYFAAVHGLETEQQKTYYLNEGEKYIEKNIDIYPTSTARIDYGYQGLPWGKKRQQDLKAFWYTNEARTMQRAEDTVYFLPIYSYSLPQESASPNLLQMFWDLNRLEKDDNWTLMTYGQRVKDVQNFKMRAEGDLQVGQGGESKKLWGFLEKPSADSNGSLVLFPNSGPKMTITDLRKELTLLHFDKREEIIKRLMDVFFERFTPLLNMQEVQNGKDRQALGAALAYENNEEFYYSFVTEWLYSLKKGTTARTDGGINNYREIENFLYLLLDPGSYRANDGPEVNGKIIPIIEEATLMDEEWRKLTPSHNPRIKYDIQEPTYTRVAA